jgi:hypothetical protein
MDLIHLNLLVNMLIWRFYIKDIILFRNSKAWHTCKARLMGTQLLSRVELMLWVRGVTIFEVPNGETFMVWFYVGYSSWSY